MEFKRLADVDIVETANDTDKVLIEQNGEIKRVPKTEVGGSSKGLLIIDANMDVSGEELIANANMTLEAALEAFSNRELSSVSVYMVVRSDGQNVGSMFVTAACADYSIEAGFPCMMILASAPADLQLMWTSDGITMAS